MINVRTVRSRMGPINGLSLKILVLGCLRLRGSKTPMTMKIGQGIGCVKIVCLVVYVTSDGTIINRPRGCC
jgi:hypothetical protein